MNEDKRTEANPTAESRTASRGDLNRYIGYDVVDKAGNKIGTLDCLWSDHTGDPAFLGVKTGWFFGKTHVVPANAAEVNEGSRIIRLPYAEDMVKGAPAYDADLTLDEATEREIYDYYHVSGGRAESATEEPFAGERPRFDTGLEHEASAPKPEGTEEARIQLSEEEIKIGKRQVEAGGVRLRKIIRTETVNQPVELQREEIVIERVPASEAQAPSGQAFSEQDVFIPLRREEAIVQKESHVREEVRAHKRTDTERQQVSESVRKEDVQVEKQGEDVRLKDREGRTS
ncbi:MAG: hypothetical protein JWQ71_2528 [Pedosphaera sp.]|nr:hypothetical protein [Pedosphaera sp.]